MRSHWVGGGFIFLFAVRVWRLVVDGRKGHVTALSLEHTFVI
jgi:hypothetical protein